MPSNGVMNSAWIPAGVLTAIALVVTWLLWPHPSRVGPSSPSTDFSATQISREVSFHNAVRPWQLGVIVINVLVPIVIAIVSLKVEAVRSLSPRSFGWWVYGVVAVVLVSLAPLPLQLVVRRHLTTVGLNTQSTAAWLVDVAKSLVLTSIVVLPVAALFVWVSRKSITMRTFGAPTVAIAMVIVMSLIVPVIVEPMFNRFTPMKQGPLRDRLMSVVQQSGVQVGDILVADASRRSTALNAYVSGFAGTRRVVVYDTMVQRVPDAEIAMVTAHELGHVAHRDVLRNTAVAATWVAVGVVALVAGAPLVAGAEVACLLAASAVASQVTAPVQSAFSRAVERAADDYALTLATSPEDVEAFAHVQYQLAIDNYAGLNPPRALYLMYATHPLAPERIEHAREVMARRGWGPLASMRDT